MENDLVGFLSLERGLAGQRTRGGSVKHRLPPERSYIASSVHSKVFDIVTYQGDHSITAELGGNNTLKVSAELPPHSLNGVAKALVRMALFVLAAEKLDDFRHLLEWLRGEVQWAPVFFQTFFLGRWLNRIGICVAYNSSTQVLRTYFGYTNSLLIMDFPAVNWRLPEFLPPMIPNSPYLESQMWKYSAPAARLVMRGRRKTIQLSYHSLTEK
jgi:hypothetical protein